MHLQDSETGDSPTTDGEQLQAQLKELLSSQRWFAGKAEGVGDVQIVDRVPITADYELAVVLVGFQKGTATRTYVLALEFASSGSRVFEASLKPDFWRHLVLRLTDGRPMVSRQGRTLQLLPGPGIECLKSFDVETPVEIHSGEQSNTSVVLGDEVFMKLFRKVETGVNPDAEVATFLSTSTNFTGTPPIVATIELTDAGQPRCLAMLSERVVAEADAWTTTLNELSEYWTRAGSGSHDMSTESLGSFPDDVMRLGRTTAEMHVALASGRDGSDFAPGPFTQRQFDRLLENIRSELMNTCHQLADTDLGSVDSTELAQSVATTGRVELDRLSRLNLTGDEIHQIRCHGDYHLGQVLWAGTDWVIIDFEGEPERPLNERREKRCALKDVAGMIRSFHYASCAGDVGLIASPSASISRPEQWREFWYRTARESFLRGYRSGTPDSGGFVPEDEGLYQQLLDLFLLEKVLYELRYELQNRPDWIPIPLAGLTEVLGIAS